MVTCVRRKKLKSSKVYSASADLIGGNEDLIDKILLCLPERSLFRFKSVSKQWNSLISYPRFCLDHTLKNPSSETGQWKDTNITTYEYHLPGKSANGVYMQGAIHLLVSHYYNSDWTCYHFDVEAEKLTKIMLPSSH
ncbi:hypothetical protein POM88_009210 [Heracleum sosnowskyi]|uniref:F-box domain-containing protein n=1 Tax=Heracleum sosnowskyi TaxID=360622 RepID=A0AAD8N812_9APIA|nr:hypothetical protein POM88_009210 [Heracleum sosnowskyi]